MEEREEIERAAVHKGKATRSHVSTIERGRSRTPDTPHPSFLSSRLPALLFSTAFPSCDSSSHIKYHWPRDPRASGSPDGQHAGCLQCSFSRRCISLCRHACLSTGWGTRFTGCAGRNCICGLSATPVRPKQRQLRHK